MEGLIGSLFWHGLKSNCVVFNEKSMPGRVVDSWRQPDDRIERATQIEPLRVCSSAADPSYQTLILLFAARRGALGARPRTLQICSTASVPQRGLHFVSCMGGPWASILKVAPAPYLRAPEALLGSNLTNCTNRAPANCIQQRQFCLAKDGGVGGADAGLFRAVISNTCNYLQAVEDPRNTLKYA